MESPVLRPKHNVCELRPGPHGAEPRRQEGEVGGRALHLDLVQGQVDLHAGGGGGGGLGGGGGDGAAVGRGSVAVGAAGSVRVLSGEISSIKNLVGMQQ